MPCLDYPCCGHEPGDCPSHDKDENERWKCVGCGKLLPLKATSSLCSKCKNRRVWEDLDFQS